MEANWTRAAGGMAQWASNMTAPSGPTCLRASLIMRTMVSRSGGLAAWPKTPPGGALCAFEFG